MTPISKLGLLAHLGGDAVGVAARSPRLDLLDEPGLLGLARPGTGKRGM